MQLLEILYKKHALKWGMLGIVALGLLVTSCDHPIEPSQQPGVVKITMQHAPQDTLIEMAGKTNILTDNDRFVLTLSEGRVIRARDTAFASLFQNMDEFRQQDHDYDVLDLRRDGTPQRFQIFETRVPPGKYDKISFVVNTNKIRLVPPGEQQITQPVVISPNVTQPIEVPVDFTIKPQRTTVVHLSIASFESLTRFRDTFRFVPKISVQSIKQP